MQIFIKTLSDSNIRLEVDSNDTIGDIKQRIYQRENISPLEQRLIFAGKQLEDNKTIQDYGILEGNTMHLVLRLLGGL